MNVEGVYFSLSDSGWPQWRNERWTALGDEFNLILEDNYWVDLIWLRFPRNAVVIVERFQMDSAFEIGKQEYERGEVVNRIEELRDQLVNFGMTKSAISVEIAVLYTPEAMALKKELERLGIAVEVDEGTP